MSHPSSTVIFTWVVAAQSSVDIIDAEKYREEGIAAMPIDNAIFPGKIRQKLVVDLSGEGIVDGLIRGYKGAVYNSPGVSKVVEIDQAFVVLGRDVLGPVESVS